MKSSQSLISYSCLFLKYHARSLTYLTFLNHPYYSSAEDFNVLHLPIVPLLRNLNQLGASRRDFLKFCCYFCFQASMSILGLTSRRLSLNYQTCPSDSFYFSSLISCVRKFTVPLAIGVLFGPLQNHERHMPWRARQQSLVHLSLLLCSICSKSTYHTLALKTSYR